jgi:phosphatidylglycerol---prolipoprotein diacylglyceryl transferase
MSSHDAHCRSGPRTPGFPRELRICGHWINSYKVFLCVGIYVGVVVSAVTAESSGFSPLRMGLGSLACAVAGLAGARIYHVLSHLSDYAQQRLWRAMWDSRSGGWSVFGALPAMVPLSFLLLQVLRIPTGTFWDCMGAGILAGGFWVRLGCVFNGCCVGRETTGWFGVRLHDVRLQYKRRIPVQFFEMFWWLLGMAGFVALWPQSFPSGTYALGVLSWYGVGRFWLEPLRESPDVISGGIRVNQLVAGLLATIAGIMLVVRVWAN